ncbi:MAG: hypothetical protein JWR38_5845 [Mucilaginibacter sp.]|nr:hypothetical protein [Mucilaginibacter sp.]
MKNYFIKLFNYDRFANELLLKVILEANEPTKPVQLLAHLLAAELVWLRRSKGLPNGMSSPWPDDFTIAHCEELIIENHEAWLAYLNQLPDVDFDSIITYQNFRGDHLQDELKDILAHVINHSTHTRAQIGQQLKLAGVQSLPITDYSQYLRIIKGKGII